MAKPEEEAQVENLEGQQDKSGAKKRLIVIGVVAVIWIALIVVVIWYLGGAGKIAPGLKPKGSPENAIPVSILIPKWSINIFTPEKKALTMELELVIHLGLTKDEVNAGEKNSPEKMEKEKKATEAHESDIVQMVTELLDAESYSNLTDHTARKRIRKDIKKNVADFLNKLFSENGMESRASKENVIIKTFRIR